MVFLRRNVGPRKIFKEHQLQIISKPVQYSMFHIYLIFTNEEIDDLKDNYQVEQLPKKSKEVAQEVLISSFNKRQFIPLILKNGWVR